jgi:hypothetical protein
VAVEISVDQLLATHAARRQTQIVGATAAFYEASCPPESPMTLVDLSMSHQCGRACPNCWRLCWADAAPSGWLKDDVRGEVYLRCEKVLL